jgi:hypothetical protein
MLHLRGLFVFGKGGTLLDIVRQRHHGAIDIDGIGLTLTPLDEDSTTQH